MEFHQGRERVGLSFAPHLGMKHMPLIQKFMTSFPHTIGSDMPVKTAMEMMREHTIRHLPVQKGGQLIGVLTDRDVKLALSFGGTGDLQVEEVMTPDPYTVTPETPMNTVLTHMAEKKLGCTIITQGNGKVVGIFTATDAVRVLHDVLEQNYKA